MTSIQAFVLSAHQWSSSMRVFIICLILSFLPLSGSVFASEIEMIEDVEYESEFVDDIYESENCISVSDNSTQTLVVHDGQTLLLLQSIVDSLGVSIEYLGRLLIVIAFLLCVIGGCDIANLIIHWSVR